MKIYLATDHAGFSLKEEVFEFLKLKKFEVVDCGALTYDETDDYTTWIPKAVEQVASDPENSRAIIFGGSGEGEAMVANRFKHVRATVYYGSERKIIELSREHNDANVLSIGARFISAEEAKEVVTEWLALSFTNEERHARRNDAIDNFPA